MLGARIIQVTVEERQGLPLSIFRTGNPLLGLSGPNAKNMTLLRSIRSSEAGLKSGDDWVVEISDQEEHKLTLFSSVRRQHHGRDGTCNKLIRNRIIPQLP
jgi:hypothetical protein